MGTRVVTVQARLGKRTLPFCGPADSHIVQRMAKSGNYYEYRLLGAIKALGLSGVFVDVGAHLGTHSLAFVETCGASRVIAIEPHEENIFYLRRNTASKHVRIVKAAVSSGPDPLRLDVPTRYHPDGFVVVNPETIDGILAALDERDVSLIKIDVAKHYGFDALKSAARTVARCRPVIAVEACEEDEHQAILGWLSEQGYRERGRYEATPTYLYTQEQRT